MFPVCVLVFWDKKSVSHHPHTSTHTLIFSCRPSAAACLNKKSILRRTLTRTHTPFTAHMTRIHCPYKHIVDHTSSFGTIKASVTPHAHSCPDPTHPNYTTPRPRRRSASLSTVFGSPRAWSMTRHTYLTHTRTVVLVVAVPVLGAMWNTCQVSEGFNFGRLWPSVTFLGAIQEWKIRVCVYVCHTCVWMRTYDGSIKISH